MPLPLGPAYRFPNKISLSATLQAGTGFERLSILFLVNNYVGYLKVENSILQEAGHKHLTLLEQA